MIDPVSIVISAMFIGSGIASIITFRSLFHLILGMISTSLGAVYLLAVSCLPYYSVVLVAGVVGMSEAVLISLLIVLSRRRKVEDFDELKTFSG